MQPTPNRELFNAFKQILFWSFLVLLIGFGPVFCGFITAKAAPEQAPLSAPSAGSVLATGYNGNGNLGTGNSTNSSILTNVVTLTTATAVATGGESSYALLQDGTVWAWGYGGNGQLGNGTTASSNSPVQVNNLTGVTAIAAGNNHALALKNDKTVWAWGYDGNGQIGVGVTSTTVFSSPVQVVGLTNVLTITTGDNFSLAIKDDNTLWAWGLNSSGQFGINNATPSFSPIQILTNVKAVAGGTNHIIAVKLDGSVQAAGNNSYGQLGNTTFTSSQVWVNVNNVTNISDISAGYNHNFARRGDGSFWAWGNNTLGQLGLITSTSYYSTPVQFNSLSNLTRIRAKGDVSLGLMADGTAWGWGYNYYGQLGIAGSFIGAGGCACSISPVKVYGSAQLVDLAPGVYHSIFLIGTVNSPVFSTDLTGVDFGYQLTGQTSLVRSLVISNPGASSLVVSSTTIGGANLGDFALSGNIFPLTIPASGSAPISFTTTPALTGFRVATFTVTSTGISSPYNFTLSAYGVNALPASYQLNGWGNNNYGQLGLGTSGNYIYTPTATTGLPGPVYTAQASTNSSYALLNDGTVWAWGFNYYGELGNGNFGSSANSNIPLKVNGLSGVIDLSTGSSTQFQGSAIKSDGSVWTWGGNNIYGYGNGSGGYSSSFGSLLPVQMLNSDYTPFTGAIKLAGKRNLQFILKTDGTLWARGDNGYGQFGNNYGPASSYWPVQVNSNIKSMATDGSFSIFLKNDGTVWTSGYNNYGQLGLGNTTYTTTANLVPGLANIVEIAAGDSFALALDNNNQVWAWGYNFNGQLGDGTRTNRTSPVPVASLTGVTAITAGDTFALARKFDGTVWGWGNNNIGQLGNGDNNYLNCNCWLHPTATPNITQAVKLAAGYQYTLGMLGTVNSPIFHLSSPSLDFGNQVSNTVSPARVFTVTNPGNSSLIVNSVNFSGANAGEFTVTQTVFPQVVVPGGSLPISITFAPATSGQRNAALNFNFNNLDSPKALALSGYGLNAALPSGTLYEWGYNSYGQLGQGNTTLSNVPVVPSGLPAPVVSAKGGNDFTLSLLSDGSLYGWGSGYHLGINSTSNYTRPVNLNFQGAIAIATGPSHALVLRSDGTVWAWGDGGGLGNDGASSLVPVQVLKSDYSPLTGIKAIQAGYNFSMALDQNGKLWSWGQNYYGQLGNGSSSSNTDLASQVNISGTILAFSTGAYHTLAVKSDGSLWAWGDDSQGQLGNGVITTTVTVNPTQINTISNVSGISAGYYYNLAVKTDGTVWAWGTNGQGQLGQSLISLTPTAVPTQIPGLKGAISVAAPTSNSSGYGWGMALKSDGTLWTWGYSVDGELGKGDTTHTTRLYGCSCEPYPERVATLSQVIDLEAGAFHGMALVGNNPRPIFAADSSLDFGNQVVGQQSFQRTLLVSNPGQASFNITGLSLSGTNATEFTLQNLALPVAVPPGGNLAINLTFSPGATGFRNATLTISGTMVEGSVTVPLSGYSIAAALPLGSIKAWGYNGYGELGTGNTTNSNVYTTVTGLYNVVAVASGQEHSLALRNDGTVWAWGLNSSGQLGIGNSTAVISSPVQVSNLKGIIAIAASGLHSFALRSDGTLFGWGSDEYGALGRGYYGQTIYTPQPVVNSDLSLFSSNKKVTKIIAGGYTTFAQTVDSNQVTSWWVWGNNGNGQYGNGINTTNLGYPVAAPQLANYSAIQTGYFHVIGLKNDGTVWTWGYNSYGQLGQGTVDGVAHFTPTQVAGLSGVTAIGAGRYHSLAASNNGNTVWGWGFNSNKQVTNSASTTITQPVSMPGINAVTSLTGGYYHTLVTKGDGTVFGWGTNGNGQLGTGNNTDSPSPVQVTGLGGAAFISANESSSLAFTPDSVARIGFSPSSLQFINTTINTPSAAKVVTLTNSGSYTLTVNSISLGGTNSSDFGLSVNATLPKDLGIGQSITASVVFTASAVGQRSANMVVSSSAPGSPQNYPLLGFVDPSTLNWNWTGAQNITFITNTSQIDQYISQADSSKWFKVTAGLNAQVLISLTSATGEAVLPADYDLGVYKDLALAYNNQLLPKSLVEISNQAAPFQYLPFQYLPFQYLPFQYLPFQYLPFQYLPFQYLPFQYLGSDKTGEAHLPFGMINEATLPANYNSQPVNAEAYNSAIQNSLLALSMRDGVSPEYAQLNTFNNTGDIYIRVRSAGGATSIANPFRLQVTVVGGACTGVGPIPANVTNPSPTPGTYKTVLVTNLNRFTGASQPDKNTMFTKLTLLANRSEVSGIVLDLADNVKFPRIAQAYTQADSHQDCPYAKNVVAGEIQTVINQYRSNGLQYVVLAGTDNVIPFIRYPDKAGLAPESDFNQVLRNPSPTLTSLKNNQVLSQDAYGSNQDILVAGNKIPVADVAVGRLVSTPGEISGMVDAYLSVNGVVSPASAEVSGYDFVADVAQAVKTEYEAAINPAGCTINCKAADSLISNNWTASQLESRFLTSRHDLVFLAGHFSPAHALAADNVTYMSTTDLLNSAVNMTNVIFMSVGCHSGFNIPTEDAVAGSEVPDWPQTFSRKGMTAIIGTGYQYGDTDLVEYSERLYLGISQQIRQSAPQGLGGMPIGLAFRQAKQNYLARTAPLNDLHDKVVLEATLYGLPMLLVNTSGQTIAPEPSIAGTPAVVSSGPGQPLGLATTDYTLNPVMTQTTVVLTSNSSQYNATYLSGKDGVSVNNLDPILPLDTRNAAAGTLVLRGVGFRGGNFSDTANVLPLTPGTATEYSRSRVGFQSNGFYPAQPWGVNYQAALAGGNQRLSVLPVQYQTSNTGTPYNAIQRQYSAMNFRLFFSSYNGQAAMANPPDIGNIQGITANGLLTFTTTVNGAASAGIQAVWVTYSFNGSGTWQSVDLNNAGNGIWTRTFSTLDGRSDFGNLVYMVQAVNGVGLVTVVTNSGRYYIPAPPPPPPPPAPLTTTVTILQAPDAVNGVAYQGQPVLQAQVKYFDTNSNGLLPLVGQPVNVQMGNQRAVLQTDGNGQVSLNLNGLNPFTLQQTPGSYQLNVSYAGDKSYAAGLAATPFKINQVPTSLTLNNAGVNTVQYSDPLSITATLKDTNGLNVGLKWVVFVGTDGNNNKFTYSVQTNSQGVAQLLTPQWPAGTYSYTVYFSGNIPGIGTVADSVYAPTSQSAVSTITIAPENAMLAYTGGVSQYTNSLLFTAKVTQENDGWPGNLALAQVKFDLRNGSNTSVYSPTVSAGGDGVAAVSTQGLTLPGGSYTLYITQESTYFTAPLISVPLTLNNPTDCLTVTSNVENGTGDCHTLLGAIKAASSLSAAQAVTITFQSVTTVTVQTDLTASQNQLHGGTYPVWIDGGCDTSDNTLKTGRPQVALVKGVGAGSSGLALGDNVTVRGLWIGGFDSYGLLIQGSNNRMVCSWIGKSMAGDTGLANGGGIQFGPNASNNQIGTLNSPPNLDPATSGVLISGNNGQAVILTGKNNRLFNNFIGVNKLGATGLFNKGGIVIKAGGQLVINVKQDTGRIKLSPTPK